MNHAKPAVLAVAAHADDEILGAGGTLAEHAQAGDRICLLILSARATSRPGTEHDEVRAHRAECVRKVASLYGADLELGEFPDNTFDTVARLEITRAVEDCVARWSPHILYTHSSADLSLDHRITAEAVAAATRPQPGMSVHTVLAWEVRSATEWGTRQVFHPTWFQPLGHGALELKRAALEVYASEMRPWPHTRSVRAVMAAAELRGAQIGHEAAEAFEVLRHVTVC